MCFLLDRGGFRCVDDVVTTAHDFYERFSTLLVSH